MKTVFYNPGDGWVEIAKAALPDDAVEVQVVEDAELSGKECYLPLSATLTAKNTTRQTIFDESVRDMFREIKRRVDPVHSMSLEEWEDGFASEQNPNREIAIWLVYSEVFEVLSKGRPMTAQKEIWKIIVTFMVHGRRAKKLVSQYPFKHLKRKEVQGIMNVCLKPNILPKTVD